MGVLIDFFIVFAKSLRNRSRAVAELNGKSTSTMRCRTQGIVVNGFIHFLNSRLSSTKRTLLGYNTRKRTNSTNMAYLNKDESDEPATSKLTSHPKSSEVRPLIKPLISIIR